MCCKSYLRALMILLIPIIGAAAAIIHIPGDYSTIHDGLIVAQTGDTVLVAPGTYFEKISWPMKSGITLLSEAGAASTIIDAGGTGRVMNFGWAIQDTTTLLDGFTLQNGYSPQTGAGIYISKASPNIRNNIIQDCTLLSGSGFTYGAGISITEGASPIIFNNIIQDCTINGRAYFGVGGGIFLESSSAHIEGNVIQNNVINSSSDYGVFGAGILIYEGESVLVLDNLIVNNTLNPTVWQCGGGGLSVAGSGLVTISGNEFTGNVARSGAAVQVGFDNSYGNVVISDCIFTGNISLSPTDNACIDLCYSSGSITDCIISDNTGSGIRIESYFLEVDSCTISGNSEDGIKHYSGNSYIHFCNIFDNDGYGVYNLTSSDIDARYCWWGDASGPGGVGSGAGDEVSTHVLYDPWLTEMGIGAADPSTQVEMHVSPNPFSSNATVSFDLPNTGLVTIQVFDLSGRKIEEGIECFLEAGNQMMQLDGSEWSPGVYLIHPNSANTNVIQRCVLVR